LVRKIENSDHFQTTFIQNSGLGVASGGDVKNKNASNVDDLELAKQLQNFIELEDAPLKRKLTGGLLHQAQKER
jgi:hypothetical protein